LAATSGSGQSAGPVHLTEIAVFPDAQGRRCMAALRNPGPGQWLGGPQENGPKL